MTMHLHFVSMSLVHVAHHGAFLPTVLSVDFYTSNITPTNYIPPSHAAGIQSACTTIHDGSDCSQLAPRCSAGLEKASCALVDECLANPQYFYVTEVLGPACVKMAEAQANPATLAGERSHPIENARPAAHAFA